MADRHSYKLIDCECNAIRYIQQSFCMLQISYVLCKPTQLKEKDFVNNQTDVLVFCEHHQSSIRKQLSLFPLNAEVLVLETTRQISDNLPNHLRIPCTIYELKHALLKARAEIDELIEKADSKVFKNLVGESNAIKKIKRMIQQVANSDSNILILGESGTGKEVIASCIHQLSNRNTKPYVPINCGAIPSELMESELFGHEKGAFTGAVSKRAGRFEMANLGTLFLDEIGDMPLPMQVKLLRVIQDSKVERVGSTVSIDVNVRLIAATNKNLDDMIIHHTFREDLYYRLNVIPIHVPTLRDRTEDIPLLIKHQLEYIRKRIPHECIFSDNAIDAMCQYDWPGNIRELANFIERMVVLCDGKVIDANDIVEQLNHMKSKQHHFSIPQSDNINIKEFLGKIEQQLINLALEKSNGIVSSAAEYLHLGRTTLIEKMKKYKLVSTEQ